MEEYALEDIYMIRKDYKLSGNYLDALKNCILIRNIIEEDKNRKVLTYKYKEYNDKEEIVKQGKVDCKVESVDENDNGELVFGESHIMCNLFTINAVKRSSTNELEYHIAFKKSNYVDKEGVWVEPTKENAYKFEQFIFDSFKIFDDIAILRGKREEDFAPVKNTWYCNSSKIILLYFKNLLQVCQPPDIV